MDPVYIDTLVAFYILWILVFLCLGEIIGWLFQKCGILRHTSEDPMKTLLMSLFYGVLALPLLLMSLSLVGVSFNRYTAFGFAICVVCGALILRRESLKRLVGWNPENLSLSSIGRLVFENREYIGVVLVFVLALSFRSFAIIGLYAPLGGDARGWAFLSQQFIESQKVTLTFGSVALPNQFNVHQLFIGLPSIVAYFSLLTGIPVPTAILMSSAITGSLAALGMYLLSKHFTDNIIWSLGSAFFVAVLSQAMFDYYSWGGNAELLAYFLGPMLIVLLLDRHIQPSLLNFAAALMLIVACALYHPYSVIYPFLAAVPVLLWRVLKRRKKESWLLSVVVLLSASAIVVILSFISLIPQASAGAYTQEYWNWRIPFFNYTWNPLNLQSFIKQTTFVFGERYHSLTNSMLAFAGAAYGLYAYKTGLTKLSGIGFPLAWFAVLFAIQENNPAGLYLVEFPIWQFIYPHRVLLALAMPMAMLAGAGFLLFYNALIKCHNLFQKTRNIQSEIRVPHSSSRIIGILIIALVVMGFAFALTGQDICHNLSSMTNDARFVSPVTDSDAAAFEWISRNTPKSAVFLTDAYDAGAYIPFFTGRQLPIPMNYFWERYPQNLSLLHDSYILSPSSESTIELLHQFNISYIYIGAGRYYGWAPRLNARDFLISDSYNLVYLEGGVFIFEVNYT